MKRIALTLSIACLTVIGMAQTKTVLTFTGQLQDESYVQLDSVQVRNITRSWSETLYFPDTTLEMEHNVSIASFEQSGMDLSSPTPNPFSGTTDVLLQLPQDESVTLSLYDINGKEYFSRTMQLEAGKHNLQLTTAIAQMYFLQVRTSLGSKAIKLLNLTKGADFDITHTFIKSGKGDLGAKSTKLATTKPFAVNDEMLFIGYRTKDSETDTVQIRTRQVDNNTNYLFTFRMGWKVGDVYYSNGIAEGMVWWLADTVVTVEGIPYGQHGKLISLTERRVFPTNQTGLMYGISSRNVLIPAYDTVDGRINTAIIKNYRDTCTHNLVWRFQAMSWCVDSLGGDWYLPAISELRAIITLVVPVLNPTLANIEGTTQFKTLTATYYWSSTADKDDQLNAITMAWKGYPQYSDVPDYVSWSMLQTTYGLVRAVKLF